jgi:hypothetical protein
MTAPDDEWRRLRQSRPWLPPAKLPPPRPRPVPELGLCARCKRANPRPGYPEDHAGHDWAGGLDGCAYVAGVICPDCLSSDEAMAVLDHRVFDNATVEFGDDMVSFDGRIFIDAADAKENQP